jgi:hypothetical protein
MSSVSDFHIWGRIEVDGASFVAITSAVPTSTADTGRTLVFRDVAHSRAEAVDLLRKRSIELGKQLRDSGDHVLDVQIE